jgi:ParB family transcriptional regulator, chromosome partitioning protein
MARRSGLGKGLNALLPDAPHAAPAGTELRQLPVAKISPNPHQPRAVFDDELLGSLAASIEALGVLQPVLVRPLGEDLYELIAGERRWRASQLVGLASIPALVREVDDNASLQQALVENLHREDLNPLEEAAGYQQLIDEFDLTQDDVAGRVGKSRSAVANTIRLLALQPVVQQLLVERFITACHGRALLAIESAEEQQLLAQRIVAEDLTVRETEEIVRRVVAAQFADDEPAAGGAEKPARSAALLEVESRLAEHLDTRVAVAMSGKRGRMVVDFANLDDLDRIFRVIVNGRETGE